ncbi:MAG: translation initiation factor IF-1 [Candidatus Dojkabacteria bacterium]
MQDGKKNTSESFTIEGEVIDVLPGLEYLVKINYQGIEHTLKAYVSGKMKSNFIQISKGDVVKVEVSLYDINIGRIVYRVTRRNSGFGPPRRPKK